MKIIDRGTVYSGTESTDRQSCAFSSIAVLGSGRWICGFRAAPTKNATAGQHVLLSWSDNEGKSWSNPVGPFAPPSIENKPGLFRGAALTALGADRVLAALCWVDHTDPALPFFNEQTEGLLDTRVLLSISEDGGETWPEPRLLDTSPLNVPTPTTGPILALANGEFACQVEINKHYRDPNPWHHRSVLFFSRDHGHSWPEHVVVTEDPENRVFYWDQRPAVLADGSILDLFWTYDTGADLYLNIHARQSFDHGRTWSPLWDTLIPGQPAPPVSLPDGQLAMVYVDRTGIPTIKGRLSGDGGRTWPENTELILHLPAGTTQTVAKAGMPDAWAEMGKFSIGLPTTARLADGQFLVTYYAGPRTDQTDVHWIRVGL
jgi:BNR repeat protein